MIVKRNHSEDPWYQSEHFVVVVVVDVNVLEFTEVSYHKSETKYDIA